MASRECVTSVLLLLIMANVLDVQGFTTNVWNYRNNYPNNGGRIKTLLHSSQFSELTSSLTSSFSTLSSTTKLTPSNTLPALTKVRKALVSSDVNLGVVDELIENVNKKVIGTEVTKGVTGEEFFIKLFYDELVLLMGGDPTQEDEDDYMGGSGLKYKGEGGRPSARKMLMLTGQQWPFMYRISSKAGLSKEYAETKSRTWVQNHCWSPNKSYQKEMDSYERKRSGDTLWPSAHALRRFRDDIEESRKRVAEDSLLLKRAAAPPPVGTTPGPAKMKPPATGRLDLGNAGGSKVEVNDQFVLQYGFPMYEKELDFDGNPLHKLMKRYRPNGHRKSRKTRASTRLTAQTLKDQVEKQYRFT